MRILFLGHQPQDPADTSRADRLTRLLASYASADTTIELGYPDDFIGGGAVRRLSEQGLLTGLNHALATGPIIRKVVWAESEGFDAVVQSNHFDPGVEAARLAVRIPVVGVFRTAVHLMSTISDRLGILVPLPAHVPYARRLLRTYALDGFVADVRALDAYGSHAAMAAQKADLAERSIAMMRRMIDESGVESIVPLGGALIPQVISARELAEAVGVPVTDNYGVGIRFAELLVRSGLSHSPLTYPPTRVPPDDYGRAGGDRVSGP